MAKAVAAREVDLEPIDRLEEKVKLLVGMIDRLRADNAKASDDNARLARELEAARNKSSDENVRLARELEAARTKASEENVRLARELEAARARLSDVEGTAAEMTVLREERHLIRSRVDDMLKQIDSLKL